MTDVIATDLQGQQIDSPIVDLFELSLPDGTTVFFHPGKDDSLSDIQFKNKTANGSGNYVVNTYTAIPAALDGMEIQADGATSRPTITIANLGTTVLTGQTNLTYDDLVGQTVTKRQTLEKYLVGGSAYDSTASTPPVEMASVKYKVDRIASETNTTIVFELAVAYDLEGIQLPRRTVVGKYCSWIYQGQKLFGKGGCSASLTGQIVYTKDDGTTATTTMLTDLNNNFLVSSLDLTISSLSAWFGSQSISKSDYRRTGTSGNYRAWVALVDHTSNTFTNHPTASGSGSDYWAEMRVYTFYTDAIAYPVGNLVLYDITINGKTVKAVWECIVATTTSTPNRQPSLDSPYWTRIDLCGKTLKSCKCKFNSVPLDGNNNSSLPSGLKQDNHPVPFGGFPATGRF